MPRWRAVLAFLLARASASADRDSRTPSLNLVVIVIDGLRADHMSLYGYPRDTTPRLAARSASGVVFDRAITQASWTLPSFATLFTSRYPEDHRVLTLGRPAPPSCVFLAQVLRGAGFRTAGFAGGRFLDPVFGLSRGFEVYRTGGMASWRFFRDTAPQAARWIRENKDKRFFVFIHGNDVHPPFDLPEQGEHVEHYYDADYHGPVDSGLPDYNFVAVYNREPGDPPAAHTGVPPPEDYVRQVDAIRSSPRDLEHIVAHHDERVREADRRVDAIFQALKEAGRDRDTVVVVTADHGLELGEKGKLATAFHQTVYNSVLHVPLVLWAPGLAPRHVEEPVQLVDLAPTMLELLGIAPPPEFKGESFAALARGMGTSGETRYAFSASSVVDDERDLIPLYAVQDRRWKLIYSAASRKVSLYDLGADPRETQDVGGKFPEAAERLTKIMGEHLGHSLVLSRHADH